MNELEKQLSALLDEALAEDALENEPEVEKAEEAGHEDGYVPAEADKEELAVETPAEEISVEKDAEEINDILDDKQENDEKIEKINELLDKINEELDMPEVKIEDNEVVEDSADKEDVYPEDEEIASEEIPSDVDVENDDVYDSDSHEQEEDVKEVVVESRNASIARILEDAGILAVEDSEEVAEGENNDVEKSQDIEEVDIDNEDLDVEELEREIPEEVDVENDDVYDDETEASDVEVDTDVVNEALSAISAMSDIELLEFLRDAGYEPSIENAQILREFNARNAMAKMYIRNQKDSYARGEQARKSATTDEEQERITTATQQTLDRHEANAIATGGSIARRKIRRNARADRRTARAIAKAAAKKTKSDAKNDADSREADIAALETRASGAEERGRRRFEANTAINRANNIAKTGNPDGTTTTNESYSDLELMMILDENGYEATVDNLLILKEQLASGELIIEAEDCSEKEYCVDTEIQSKEMTGTEKTEEGNEGPKAEDIVDTTPEVEKPEEEIVDQNIDVAGDSEENEKISESVQYTSIKEACMLDEGYFYTDSYLKESADEKQARLVEQVALILAREASDPLYEELLKSAAYTNRLQEACSKKYKKKALAEAAKIMGECPPPRV